MVSLAINTTSLWVLAVAFSLLVCYYLVIPVFTSPLRRVPHAHWSCGICPLWILWTRYRHREMAVLAQKHQQLGPIIRVGPADLSISSYNQGIRTVYHGGFDKPAYYDFFAYYGQTNAFSSLTRPLHAQCRRRITSVYSKSSLFTSEPLACVMRTILLERMLPLISRHAAAKQATDALWLSYSLSLGILTAFVFGLCRGSDFLRDADALREWNRHYEQRFCAEAFWVQEMPGLTRVLRAVGVNVLPKTLDESMRFLDDWVLAKCYLADGTCGGEKDKGMQSVGDVPVVYQTIKKGVEADMPDASREVKAKAIASELMDHVGLVLAYTIYYISQNPEAQAKLRAELATVEPSLAPTTLPPPSSLDKLPYLSALLKESFRMRPNSTPLPRITPRDRSVSIAGIDNIPPSTRVNAFQWFVHRNPEIYPQPNEWLPERWLHEDAAAQPLWAFCSGSRMCAGTSLTQYLVRYILAVLYSNFSSRVVSKKTGAIDPGSSEDEIMVQFEPL